MTVPATLKHVPLILALWAAGAAGLAEFARAAEAPRAFGARPAGTLEIVNRALVNGQPARGGHLAPTAKLAVPLRPLSEPQESVAVSASHPRGTPPLVAVTCRLRDGQTDNGACGPRLHAKGEAEVLR